MVIFCSEKRWAFEKSWRHFDLPIKMFNSWNGKYSENKIHFEIDYPKSKSFRWILKEWKALRNYERKEGWTLFEIMLNERKICNLIKMSRLFSNKIRCVDILQCRKSNWCSFCFLFFSSSFCTIILLYHTQSLLFCLLSKFRKEYLKTTPQLFLRTQKKNFRFGSIRKFYNKITVNVNKIKKSELVELPFEILCNWLHYLFKIDIRCLKKQRGISEMTNATVIKGWIILV